MTSTSFYEGLGVPARGPKGDRGDKGDQGDLGPIGPAGPSPQTVFQTLAALKAADSTLLSYTLTDTSIGGIFFYETANAPYTADNVDVVKLDSVSLSVGALVRSTPTVTQLKSTQGASTIGLLSGDTLQAVITGLTQSTAYLSAYGVTESTTPAQNLAFAQAAFNSGASRIVFPAHTVLVSGTITYAFSGQQAIGACPYRSILKKASESQGSLLYASGKDNVRYTDLRTDGSRTQTVNFGVGKWNVFFNNCTNVVIDNCYSYGSLTDNIVVELCRGVVITNTRSHDSGKGGIYASASEDVMIAYCQANDNYSSGNTTVNFTGPLGTGIAVANTWRVSLIGNTVKNNQLGQITFSRGNKDVKCVANTLGDRQQIRGVHAFHTIGESTTGTVHGTTYDGVTKYGTEGAQLTGNTTYLPDTLTFLTDVDFIGHTVDAQAGTHGTTIGFCQKLRYHPGCRISTVGVGAGFALAALDGNPAPTDLSFDGVDFKIPSTIRIFDYTPGAVSTYSERRSAVDGVLVGNTPVSSAAATYVPPSATYTAPTGGTVIDVEGRAALAQAVTNINNLVTSLGQLAADNGAVRGTANGLATRLRSQGLILT